MRIDVTQPQPAPPAKRSRRPDEVPPLPVRGPVVFRDGVAPPEACRILGAAIAHMASGLAMFDADERLVLSNARYWELLDLLPRDLPAAAAYRDILLALEARAAPGADRRARERRVEEIRNGRRVMASAPSGQGRFELPVGERTVAITHRAMPEGGWVSVLEDISDHKRSAERMRYLATHDPATGLGNRALFRERMNESLAAGPGILLFLDLDRFKRVNDMLGHEAGDAVLAGVADRLRDRFRSGDHVARLGGDEFAALLVDQDPDRAAAAVRNLIDDIARPIAIRDRRVSVGVSVGIARFPCDGADPDALLRRADLALYRAKQDGSGSFRFFEPAMEAVPS